MRSCCVAGCKNTSCCEMLHFFTFPKTKERTEWIKFAEREDWTPSKYSIICSDHFCSQLIKGKKHLNFPQNFPPKFSARIFPPEFSTWIFRQNFRHPPKFSWDAGILCICWYFKRVLIFYDFSWFCCCKYLCIFSWFIYAFVYAPIFLAQLFWP